MASDSARLRSKQAGSFLVKFALAILILAAALVAGGVAYLGSAQLPAPSAQVSIPVPDDALQQR
ncbi:MAG: hypothetical protein KI792_03090 [Alphaproteobacteria bacterium]|nr:hypothetical protein [Alphaproteobacteria bacterium SS10]